MSGGRHNILIIGRNTGIIFLYNQDGYNIPPGTCFNIVGMNSNYFENWELCRIEDPLQNDEERFPQ